MCGVLSFVAAGQGYVEALTPEQQHQVSSSSSKRKRRNILQQRPVPLPVCAAVQLGCRKLLMSGLPKAVGHSVVGLHSSLRSMPHSDC